MDVVNGLLPVGHQPGFCSGVLCVIPVTKPQFCCCELVPLACCTAPALHGESSAMLSCVCVGAWCKQHLNTGSFQCLLQDNS